MSVHERVETIGLVHRNHSKRPKAKKTWAQQQLIQTTPWPRSSYLPPTACPPLLCVYWPFTRVGLCCQTSSCLNLHPGQSLEDQNRRDMAHNNKSILPPPQSRGLYCLARNRPPGARASIFRVSCVDSTYHCQDFYFPFILTIPAPMSNTSCEMQFRGLVCLKPSQLWPGVIQYVGSFYLECLHLSYVLLFGKFRPGLSGADSVWSSASWQADGWSCLSVLWSEPDTNAYIYSHFIPAYNIGLMNHWWFRLDLVHCMGLRS